MGFHECEYEKDVQNNVVWSYVLCEIQVVIYSVMEIEYLMTERPVKIVQKMFRPVLLFVGME